MTDKPEAFAYAIYRGGVIETIDPTPLTAADMRAGFTAIPLYAHPPAQPDASALVEAAKALCDAITQDNRIGVWYIDADDPEALACNLHSTLTALEAQHG